MRLHFRISRSGSFAVLPRSGFVQQFVQADARKAARHLTQALGLSSSVLTRGSTMKGVLVVLVLSISALAASCATVPAAQPDTTMLRKESHDLTHLLVDKDAAFPNSISQILPNGVYRMSPAEFSKLTVRSSTQTLVRADSFGVGKTKAYEIKRIFDEPIRESKDRDGSFVYSYDASDGSIVTYLFTPDGSLVAPDGTLEKSYGYHVTSH